MNKVFVATLDDLYDMLGFIHDFAEAVGFDRDTRSRIELASEEALVNIISYGYPETAGIIEISCICPDQNEMRIRIKDNGIPFNPLNNIEKFEVKEFETNHTIGGYGTYIMIKMMDDVHYHRTENSNILTLVKYLNPTD